MPGSVTSVFSEPDDFQAALREDGVLSLLITGRSQFRARLTQVTLHRWRLWTSEEHLSRIGFVAVPANAILVLLPISSRVASIWGGIGMKRARPLSERLRYGPEYLLASRQRMGWSSN
jgi:hypothetical protein